VLHQHQAPLPRARDVALEDAQAPVGNDRLHRPAHYARDETYQR
jgi:hypothetical protein